MPKNLGTYDDDYSVPRKKDVDSKLSLSGGTLTGPLELESDLTFTNATSGNILFSAGAAIRATRGVLSIEPSNNRIEMSSDSSLQTIVKYVGTPSDDTDAANKAYVDGAVADKADASTLTAHINNKSNPHGVTAAQVKAVPQAGGTMTGHLTLSGAPTENLHAATKDYVDSAAAGKVSLSGGTMTGLLTLSGAPTANLHAATKAYVDSEIEIACSAVKEQADETEASLAAHKEDMSNPHGVTAAQAGALPITGGTLTGALNFSAGGLVQSWKDANNYSNIAMQAQDGTKYTSIQVYVKDGEYGANLWSTEADGGKVLLHTGNIGSVAARQEIGFYTGVGAYTPKELTFSFVPQVVFVVQTDSQTGAGCGTFVNGFGWALETTAYTAAWSDKTLTLSSSGQGLNADGAAYKYIALG